MKEKHQNLVICRRNKSLQGAIKALIQIRVTHPIVIKTRSTNSINNQKDRKVLIQTKMKLEISSTFT